jgi:hypothetical protein
VSLFSPTVSMISSTVSKGRTGNIVTLNVGTNTCISVVRVRDRIRMDESAKI